FVEVRVHEDHLKKYTSVKPTLYRSKKSAKLTRPAPTSTKPVGGHCSQRINQSANNWWITAGTIVKPIAAKRLKMAMDIVIISSSHGRDLLPSLALGRRSRARSVGCLAAGFAKAHREQGDN